MASRVKKRQLLVKTALYGAVTAVLYAVVFTNLDFVMQLFTRGGVYAALPIATVFIFSFAHGAFAGNLWSALGIDAVTRKPAERPEVRPTRPARRPRARLRISL